jgi:predicted GTPase
MRPDGRRPDQLRPLEISTGFQKHAEGSALVKLGDTWVLCAASVEENGIEIAGKRVLAVEDGPTLTHGAMTYGAAVLASKEHGAASLVDPRPFAVGSIAQTFVDYPNVGTLLPAMGYGREQMEDLRETIARSDADLVLIGTPIDLRRLIELDKPALRVTYRLQELDEPGLAAFLEERGIIETALV